MTTTRRTAAWVACALILCSSAAAARGEVIFSSLPADNSTGWTVSASDSPITGADIDVAFPFSVASDWRFTDLRLPLMNVRGPGAASVFLMAADGPLPGALMEQMTVTGISNPPQWEVKTGTSSLGPLLSAGQTYWIGVSTDVGNDVAWGEVASGAHEHWYRTNQGPWQHDTLAGQLGAFEVDGVPVPEPSCLVAFAAALLPAALRRPRRPWRRRSSRAGINVTQTVKAYSFASR